MDGLFRAALLASTALTVTGYAARAQTAAWSTTPTGGNYANAANWNGGVVPNGETATAVFGASTQSNLVITPGTPTTYAIAGWTFSAGAPNYTFNLNNNATLGFWGTGITNNGTGTIAVTNNGNVNFFGSSTAGPATTTITNGSSGYLRFYDTSTAGGANITNNNYMWLYGNSTAGSATITNNFGLTFFNSSTAGNANITNNSYLYFQNSSTAGSANVTNTGTLRFYNNSTGGSAAIITGAGATTDFSTSTGPNGDGKLSAGSIAGGGSYMLGSNQLTVGSNGLSTEVTGVISGTGSLVKTGSGTLTLSGINVYSGGTTINGGTLQIGTAANTGAVSGAVTVNAGSTLNVTNAITSWITGITNIGTTNFQTGTSASSIAFGNSGYLNFYEIGRASCRERV